MLEPFMHQWLAASDMNAEMNNGYAQKGQAYGIDFNAPYVAVVIESNQGELPDYRFAFDLDHLRRVYIVQVENVEKLLLTMPAHVLAGVGQPHKSLKETVTEGIFALSLTSSLVDSMRVVYYKDISSLAAVVKTGLVFPETEQLLQRKVDEEVQLTLWLYGTYGHSMSDLSDALHVHRRTIQYRLDKIMKLTGFNPRVPADNVPLLVSYMRLRTTQIVPALVARLERFSQVGGLG